MSPTRAIRHRLLTILLLGVVTSALTLAALVQLLSTMTKQRVERAHEGVTEEVARLAHDPRDIVEPYGTWIVGMRGGVWDDERTPQQVPATWAPSVRTAVTESAGVHGPSVEEAAVGDSTLVIAAQPTATGSTAWAGVLVRPLPTIRTWQWIVVLLAAATALLVATTVYAMIMVQQGAAALRSSLAALATDLSTPVPRPALRELGDVADGIARLAERLVQARAEEERLGRELAGKERLAALGRVVAGVAHEVRNPLASIKLRLDLAATGNALPPVAADAMSHASSEIARLDRLVADLLVVAGRASGPRASGSLGALVRARVEAMAPWSSERGVAVDALGDAEAQVHGDAVARAIDNLLRNAVEASPRGGRVAVRVRAKDGGASVRIEDRGPGVPTARATELFEPFFTTKPEGTGLGLALSRAIARQHGGDVTYARDGEITCFELTVATPNAAGDKESRAKVKAA